MRVNSPIMSVDARGAFGPGVVFGRYRGTNCARTRIRTPVRRSAAEQTVKNNMALGARAWADLTDLQRASWETYAGGVTRYNKMGDPYSVSGQCEFMGNYSIKKLIGDPPRLNSPTDTRPPGVIGFGIRAVLRANSIRMWWEWPTAGARCIEIFLSKPRGWARKYYANQATLHIFKTYPDTFIVIAVARERSSYGYRVRYISEQGQGGPWTKGAIKVTGLVW